MIQETFAGVAGAATLWVWIRFDLDVRWVWSPCSGEDAGDGGGCGYVSEPFGGCSGEQSGSKAAVSTPASTATAASDKAGPAVRLVEQAARTTAQVRQTGQGLKEGSKRFGEAVWGPLVRLSGVLWLEFTGVFFGIFAVRCQRGLEDVVGVS